MSVPDTFALSSTATLSGSPGHISKRSTMRTQHVLLDHNLDEVIEFYATQRDADRELGEILADEPDWPGKFEIVDFGGLEPTVAMTG